VLQLFLPSLSHNRPRRSRHTDARVEAEAWSETTGWSWSVPSNSLHWLTAAVRASWLVNWHSLKHLLGGSWKLKPSCSCLGTYIVRCSDGVDKCRVETAAQFEALWVAPSGYSEVLLTGSEEPAPGGSRLVSLLLVALCHVHGGYSVRHAGWPFSWAACLSTLLAHHDAPSFSLSANARAVKLLQCSCLVLANTYYW